MMSGHWRGAHDGRQGGVKDHDGAGEEQHDGAPRRRRDGHMESSGGAPGKCDFDGRDGSQECNGVMRIGSHIVSSVGMPG
jgi:hypothetical protein